MSSPNIALVVQPFVKQEALLNLLSSLKRLETRENLRLVLFSDNAVDMSDESAPNGSQRRDAYVEKNAGVMALLEEFRSAERSEFLDVVVRQSERHLGPYATCRAAIDFAFEGSEHVIFTEDDLWFSPDALVWFRRALSSPLFADANTWVVAGESIYFDARGKVVSEETREAARRWVGARGYCDQYQRFHHAPGSCFATSREKWALFGESRGQVNGDMVLSQRVAAERKIALFPIVPRVKDLGATDPDSYSVMIHGLGEIVRGGTPNTYLLSGDVAENAGGTERPLSEFTGSVQQLFRQTVELTGFDP